MSTQELIYVAYRDEHLDDERSDHGISYAIYLSKVLSETLRVLLLSPRGSSSRFNDVVSSVASVSPFPHTQADAAAAEWEHSNSEAAALAKDFMLKKCSSQGIAADVHIGLEANAAEIMRFLRRMKVHLVLLSPRVTETRHIHKRLVKSSPRPVVTMARGAAYPALGAQADAGIV
ncbi:MAG: hypothetical protein ACYCXU_07705 [Thermoleophilia bacterium]|jgi:hypothetical protein|nr:hypothetical protein [Actinomycetota bacterium]MDA8166404.1 hypothetical protein [Actinomycetota bacterium]